MLTKRIIPCLDVKNGKVVKGINFETLREMGNPVSLAKYYASAGADELVFLDITATNEKRKTLIALVSEVATAINIPFTVGGGISKVDDVYALLYAGVDKISINSAAVNNVHLIKELATNFGSQCIVLAIDTKLVEGEWLVFTHGGRNNTSINLFDWIKKVTEMGAGEILLTSIDHDGTKNGFANELIDKASTITQLPIIASGGAGNAEHFKDIFLKGRADAALAASIFHNKALEIPVLKQYLVNKKISVRL